MRENEKADAIERRPLLIRHEQSHEDAIDLMPSSFAFGCKPGAYWNILSKRRWEILTTSLLASVITAVYSFSTKPVYRATAQVEIDAEQSQTESIDYPYRPVPTDVIFLKTQGDVLESANLAGQTIQQLGLTPNAEFPALDRSGEEPNLQASQDRALKEFRKRLIVTFKPTSRVIGVSFESTDPDLAARIVNTLISNYVEYDFHKKYDTTHQVAGWMEQQLDALKAKVEKSQQALVDYERKHAIVSVSEKQNVAEGHLADLTKDLTVAESERAQKESLYNLLKPNNDQAGLIAQNELLQRLEEKYADLNSEYVANLGQYGPNFPKVKTLRDQVNELQSLIDRERQRSAERIRNEFSAAVGRGELLSASVARAKAEVGRMNQLLIQHNILKRDFDTNQQLYANLLQRLKDATVSAGLRATNIHVLDPAVTPTYPVRPKRLLSVATGFILGALLGIVLAFVQESLDVSVRTVEDAEALIHVPSLAMIPGLDSGHFHQYPLLRSRKTSGNGPPALAVLRDPGSPFAEAYRGLRTAILLSTAPRPPQTLLVTSAYPDEGKTCTALNLASALAKPGSRVLIVDADLRKPKIAELLGVSNDKGLSGILAGAYSLDEALRIVDILPNLSVLPAGPRPPSPADLFSSPSMRGLLQDLCGRFEHIVLDSAPSLPVTDATILSVLVDGVIIVVRSGATSGKALIRSYRTIEGGGAKILGTVVNRVNLRHEGYGRYQGYYSYGEDNLAGRHSTICAAVAAPAVTVQRYDPVRKNRFGGQSLRVAAVATLLGTAGWVAFSFRRGTPTVATETVSPSAPAATATTTIALAASGKAASAAAAPAMPTEAHARSAPVVIEKVHFDQVGERTEVSVTGSGPLDYHVLRLTDPDRLVLDFVGAWLKTPEKSLPSNLDPVRQVRMGQFSPTVTRIVIDMREPAPYSVHANGHTVKVEFSREKLRGALVNSGY